MVMTNFRVIDFKKDGSAVEVARSKRDRVQPAAVAKTPARDPRIVPEGTIPEVLSWVNEDASRAQRALDVELKDSKPRKGLVDELKRLADTKEDVKDVTGSKESDEDSTKLEESQSAQG